MSGAPLHALCGKIARMTEDVLARARRGDLEALAGLLETCAPALRALLDRRLPATHRAVLAVEDVLQVTWLEAFLAIERCASTSEAGFAAWLRAIAERNLQDAVRELERDKRPDSRGRADAAAELLDELAAGATSPTHAAARSEARDRLEAALRTLPADYALVVRRHDLDGCGLDELARELGRSLGALHMLRQRAHDRLRERLGAARHYLTSHE
jgi:RNA polymerase sigma factor (sigma-70 family)